MLRLPTLMRLGRSVNNLNNTGLLEFVKHVIETGHSETIVSGIFKQLRIDGADTSQEYLNDLLQFCQELNMDHQKTENKSNDDVFDKVSDSILNVIISYSDIKSMFSIYSRLNSRFLGIVMNVNNQLKECSTQWTQQMDTNPPRFGIEPLFRRISHLIINTRNTLDYMKSYMDRCGLQNVKIVEVCMLYTSMACVGGTFHK